MAINKYQTKSGTRYQVQVFHEGKRVASKAGFQTKRAARKWEAEYEAESLPTDTGLLSIVNKYLDEVEAKRARNTYGYKCTCLKRLVGNMGEVGALVRGLYAERGPKAANRNLREFKTFFAWAIRYGYHPGPNPCAHIEPYPEEQYVRYVPPKEDVAAVRLAAKGKARAIVDMLYFTGARLSEVLSLKWEDVDLKQGTVRLWTRKRRGGSRGSRVLALPNSGKMLLNLYQNHPAQQSTTYIFTNPLTGAPYSRNSGFIKALIPSLCKRAGVKPFTAHCLRHHHATLLMDAGIDRRVIQGRLGHQRFSTTETYLHEMEVDRTVSNLFEEMEDDAVAK